MFSIIATKPEMQELSEVLDKYIIDGILMWYRVAYQFVILGMIFTALADHSIK